MTFEDQEGEVRVWPHQWDNFQLIGPVREHVQIGVSIQSQPCKHYEK